MNRISALNQKVKGLRFMPLKSGAKGSVRREKAVLLAVLYTSQMLGIAFLITALPAILRQSGIGLDKIGWVYALGFIWSLKCFWAPLVDRFGSKKHGHYRSWILVTQIMVSIILFLVSFFTLESQLSYLIVFFALIAVFSATQDIATDALAVTILEPEERGTGNGIQSAGNLTGTMIGGGMMLMTYQWLGWRGSMLVLAAFSAIPLISLGRYREKTAPADTRVEKANFKDLVRFFRRPGILSWICVLIVFRMSNTVVFGLLNPFLVDLGWGLDRIGFSTNITGPLFGIAGAAICGLLVDRWRRKSVILMTMLFTVMTISCLFITAQGFYNPIIIYAAIALNMAAYGSSSTVMYTIIMDKSNPASAGTDFSLQMSLSRIPTFIVGGLVLGLVESIGYSGILSLLIGITVPAIILILMYDDFEVRAPG